MFSFGQREQWVNSGSHHSESNNVFTDSKVCLASRLEALVAIQYSHVFEIVDVFQTYKASKAFKPLQSPKLAKPLSTQTPDLNFDLRKDRGP